MSARLLSTPLSIYQLHISLRGVSPHVWRRLLVKSDTNIAELHAIVQCAMGWEDLHLHRFRIHGKDYGVARLGGLFFQDDPATVFLTDFRLRPGERLLYEYDMGDLWQHDIRLERVLPAVPGKMYPVCVAGVGDCPPEDCGGPAGYQSLLDHLFSWEAEATLHDDLLLIAEQLQDFLQGGPRPTSDDEEFVDAFERIQERQRQLPAPFCRQTVNEALSAIGKETTCTSKSRSSP